MTLQERIEAAIQRITNRHAPMRIPVDQTDVDIVLSDCSAEILRLKSERDEALALYGEIVVELEAAQALTEFAWTAVTADCEEARVYLNSLVADLRAALEDK